MTLLDGTALSTRLRLLRKSPVADADGQVVGYVRERLFGLQLIGVGLQFFDEGLNPVVRVSHRIGFRGSETLSFCDADGRQFGRVAADGIITIGDECVGILRVASNFGSATVSTLADREIAAITRLSKDGFSETYGYSWRLTRAPHVEERLAKVTLACFGGLLLTHMAWRREE